MKNTEIMFGFAMVVVVLAIGSAIATQTAQACPDMCVKYANANVSTWLNRTPEYYECISNCTNLTALAEAGTS
jgi:hypothetical protein